MDPSYVDINFINKNSSRPYLMVILYLQMVKAQV